MKRIGLLAVLALLATSTVQAQLNGVTAELQLDQDQYLPGEDLQLKLRILNRSGQPITLGADNDWIIMSITGENGVPCARLGVMPVQGEFSLLSGQVGTKALNPTPYFDYRGMGRYRITAKIRIPQWQQEIPCKSASFTVGSGVALPNLANLQFGMPLPPGVSNAVPEVRKYSLLKVSYIKDIKLYFRLTDSTGRVLRVFPIAGMTSFSEPEAQIDRDNNLHVLHQTGARSFNYAVISPEGQWVGRQTYMYTDTRPVLRVNGDGQIFVAGGERRLSRDDFPAPVPESARQ
jgi:hypothetical protein